MVPFHNLLLFIDKVYCSSLEDPYNYLNQFSLMNVGQDELVSERNEYLNYKLIIKNGRKVSEYLHDLIKFVLVDSIEFLRSHDHNLLFKKAC
jgi:hypothetical protein